MGENIDLGDNVEFTIQTRNGKEVATNIIKLVAGTVVFEDVGTEYFRGQVLKVSSKLYIIDAVGSSRILIGKQKIDLTFNSDKLGGNDFTKFSKLTMCSA